MRFWIVDSMVYQAGQMDPIVHRHSTVAGGTDRQAVEAVHRAIGGTVTIVGYIENGSSHYFPR
jgi:hypothetical protein